MTPADTNPVAQPGRPWSDRAIVFLLLVFAGLTFPRPPTIDLDASWRMALGKYLLDGLQFGRDVVFTYGPLGFLMGKTYHGSGLLFWGMLLWQYVGGACFAGVIMLWGERMAGRPRLVYYAFFILFGVVYEDGLHMLVIALSGFELIRRTDQAWRWSSVLLILLLALLSVMKFTNLMLSSIILVVASAHELWRHRRREAARMLAWFASSFLALWLLCGQNPLNLPAYFLNSWIVSQGYQDAMGIPTPPAALWKALVVLGLLAVYLLDNFLTQKDRARTVACSTVLAALIFLNWKHGFVRADGHMIGFFDCALLPVVAFPVLLADTRVRQYFKQWLLILAGVFCLLGQRDALPGMIDYTLAQFQGRVWTNARNTAGLPGLRATYDEQLAALRNGNDLIRTRALVGNHPVDVIGFEQAVAMINGLNYQPRPVIQSYSAYTPELAKLNADYYASAQAPDYVLVKIQSIDARLPTMDDPDVLRLLIQRYDFLFSERGFHLWQRKAGAFDATKLAPQPLQTETRLTEQPFSVAAHSDQALWLQVDLQPTLLGHIRKFFYKPPPVKFTITLVNGDVIDYLMALPQGRAGFILNPVIEDYGDYLRFANNALLKKAVSVALKIDPEDRKYFASQVLYQLSSLPPCTVVKNYDPEALARTFHMFKSFPVTYEAHTDIAFAQIDQKTAALLHAPSQMAFRIPFQADTLSGQFGMVAGSYSDGGKTNGAEFVIYWSDGTRRVELFKRYLDPLHVAADQGLQNFKVNLQDLTGGRVYLETRPGPFDDTGWDWTCWTGIEFSKAK